VDHLRAVRSHDERRFLDGVVTDRHDHVGPIHRLMHVVALGQRSGPHVQISAARHGAFAHLGGKERDLRASHEARQSGGRAWPGRGGSQHDQRSFGGQDHGGRAVQCIAVRDRGLDRMHRDRQQVRAFLAGHVLGQLQQHGAGPFLHGDAEGVAHDSGDAGRGSNLPRRFRQRPEGADDVDDLETSLEAGVDRLLPGDHYRRHRPEIGVGRPRCQVQRDRPERGDTDAGLAGQPAIRRGHERRRLFVSGKDQFYRRLAQAFDYVEVFFPRDTENMIDPLVFESGYKQIRTLGHILFLRFCFGASGSIGPSRIESGAISMSRFAWPCRPQRCPGRARTPVGK
jgi:hypothetical protein